MGCNLPKHTPGYDPIHECLKFYRSLSGKAVMVLFAVLPAIGFAVLVFLIFNIIKVM